MGGDTGDGWTAGGDKESREKRQGGQGGERNEKEKQRETYSFPI